MISPFQFGDSVALFAANVAVAAMIVSAIGWAAARLLRAASAPLLHALLLSALVAMIAAPAAGFASICLGIGAFPVTLAAHADPTANGRAASAGENNPDGAPARVVVLADSTLETAAGSAPAIAQGNSGDPAGRPAAGPAGSSRRQPAYAAAVVSATALAVLWLLGTALALCRLAKGFLKLHRFSRTLQAADDPRLLTAARLAAAAAGSPKYIPVAVSAHAPAPLTLGLFHPRIVVPSGLAGVLSDEELLRVLTHESAHVVRRDGWSGLIARLAGAIYWWNPLVRGIVREMSSLREAICDDHAAGSRREGRCYAAALVKVAEWYAVSRRPALPLAAALLDGDADDLARRVLRLTDSARRPNRRLSARGAACAASAALVLLASSLLPVLRAGETPEEAAEEERSNMAGADENAGRDTLEGRWYLSLPAGFVHEVTLTKAGESRYRLDPAHLNMSGVYELREDRLVIVEPNDSRLTEFVWKLDDQGLLTMIAEPSAGKTGASYAGATMLQAAGKKKHAAQQAAEDFLAAIVDGRPEAAAALAVPGSAVDDGERIAEFAGPLEDKQIVLSSVTVVVAGKRRRAVVVTRPIAFEPDGPAGADKDRLLLTLEKGEMGWRVADVDLESADGVQQELRRFFQQRDL